ncbi:MAG: hypothetical protein HYY46_23170 [Deltaproteobacteria bacterium]|nr:hypothetical protein [Deltaproteobacteria bacterium]
MNRRDLIRQSAERARSKREPMKARGKRSNGATEAPKPRPGTKPGPKLRSSRWVRLPSHTLTVHDADLDSVKRIVEDAIREHAGDVNEPGKKIHVQLTPKVLRE